MENANSPEYLEKIKIAVIENLKKTIPAPSVQMQDVPRHGMNVMTDEDDAELDDEDADNNPDVRMTQRAFEKRTVADNEFEESDDEDMAEANGVFRTNGKRKIMSDFKNAHEDPEPDFNDFLQEKKRKEVEAEAASLHAELQEAINNEEADETMEDIEDEIIEAPEPEEAAETAPTPPIVESAEVEVLDKDGDVDMEDAVEPEAAAPIKQEDADVQPAPVVEEPTLTDVVEKQADKPAEEAPLKDVPIESTEPAVEPAVEPPAEAAVPKQNEEDAAPADAPAPEPEKSEPEPEQAKSPAKPSEPVEDESSKAVVEDASKTSTEEKTGEGDGASSMAD